MFTNKRCDKIKLKIDPWSKTRLNKVNWHTEHIIKAYFNEKTNTAAVII